MLHDSPGTVVFWCKWSLQNSDGITPNRGAKWRWRRWKLHCSYQSRSLRLRRLIAENLCPSATMVR